MNFRFSAHLVAAFLLCLSLVPSVAAQESAPAQTAPTMPPLDAYGSLPEVEEVALSHSGKRTAFIATVQGQRLLMIIEDGRNLIEQVAVGDIKIRYLEWAGDDALMMVTSQTQDLGFSFTTDKAELYVATVLPIGADGARQGGQIFGNRRNLVSAIFGNYGMRRIDGRWYGFFGALELAATGAGGYTFQHGRPYLYRVDLEDFSTKRIARPGAAGEEKDWLIDARGELAAELTISSESGKWLLDGPDGKVIAQGQNAAGRVGLLGLGYDGTTAILSERTEGGVVWYEVPLAGGAMVPFLDDVDVDRVYFDDMTGHLAGYLEGGSMPRTVMRDPAHEKATNMIRRAFPNLDMRMADWTSDFSNVIVRTSGNADSGTYFTVDVINLRAQPIAYEREQILPEHVGPISEFKYTASDGMEMDGILTVPPGREAKNLPVIVLPHGGPHAHDTVSFDWWAQAFASRGYAVFQPNFRGSTGRTGAFVSAGYGQWGRKMQTDKSDGLAALAEAGIVDPERACIVGASYGGYAALAGVTLQNGLYRCAVAVAPVSDIRNMFNEDYRASGRDGTTRVSLMEQLGPSDGWNEVSPMRAAERADAPVLLIHGKDDTVVPYRHSTRMADKLKDAGKPYELVTLDGEDHWLSLSETRKRMLAETMAFVQRHNPAD